MSKERWRPVPGFPRYKVSSMGRVKRTASGRVLKLWPRGRYILVTLSPGNKLRAVHILMAEAFRGPRPLGTLVRHLDDDGANNCLANIRWGTHEDNYADSVRNGGRRR